MYIYIYMDLYMCSQYTHMWFVYLDMCEEEKTQGGRLGVVCFHVEQ